MENLAKKKCAPCQAEAAPLKGEALRKLVQTLKGGWKVVNDHHLEKEYKFKNFAEALDFTNKIGAIAEEEGHHPDILLTWGKVQVVLWTHKIGGLSENDFIMAAKCDEIYPQKKAA